MAVLRGIVQRRPAAVAGGVDGRIVSQEDLHSALDVALGREVQCGAPTVIAGGDVGPLAQHAADEGLDQRDVVIRGGPQQRRAHDGVGRVDVRPVRDEEAEALVEVRQRALLRREHENNGLGHGILRVDGRAALEKHAHGADVAPQRGDEQRGLAVAGALPVWVGAVLQEERGDIGVAALGGAVDGGDLIVAGGLDVGAALKEEADQGQGGARGGLLQGDAQGVVVGGRGPGRVLGEDVADAGLVCLGCGGDEAEVALVGAAACDAHRVEGRGSRVKAVGGLGWLVWSGARIVGVRGRAGRTRLLARHFSGLRRRVSRGNVAWIGKSPVGTPSDGTCFAQGADRGKKIVGNRGRIGTRKGTEWEMQLTISSSPLCSPARLPLQKNAQGHDKGSPSPLCLQKHQPRAS